MIWQCVWNGGQVEPSPLSGAISPFLFFRLNSKQTAASEMTTLQRQPQVTLWWTRRSISAVDFSGEIVTAPHPHAQNPSPQFCWGLISAGQTQGVWWENSGDDLRTVLHISRAKAGCSPRRRCTVLLNETSICDPPKEIQTGAALGRTTPGISVRKSIAS